MKPRCLLLACCVLLPAASVFAQSQTAAADPISGTWIGTMGRTETDRNAITVNMKFDGKTAVSGTITGPPSPGVIKTGTFDRKTGALKLEITIKDDPNAAAVFEGTVVKDTATGRVQIGNQTGSFTLTKRGGKPAAASQPGGNDATMAALRSFEQVNGWVAKAADLVPADKYTYQPAKTVRTFGQLIGHIADGYNYYCANAAGRKTGWSEAGEKGNTDKATVVQKLKQSTDACNAAYGATSQVGPLIDLVGHTNLHYGNIITYMRMLGLTPPSS